MLGSHSFCFLHVRSLRLTHVEAGDSRRRPTGGTFSGTATPFGLGAGVASSNPPLVFLNTIFQNHRKHVFILHKIIYNQRSFLYLLADLTHDCDMDLRMVPLRVVMKYVMTHPTDFFPTL